MRKIFYFRFSEIGALLSPSRPTRGRIAVVTNVGAGCGGRDAVACAGDRRASEARERERRARRAAVLRTAKPCGPGVQFLFSALQECKIAAPNKGFNFSRKRKRPAQNGQAPIGPISHPRPWARVGTAPGKARPGRAARGGSANRGAWPPERLRDVSVARPPPARCAGLLMASPLTLARRNVLAISPSVLPRLSWRSLCAS